MRIFLSSLLAASALSECFAGPIDFTPSSGQRELEGMVFPQLLFHQDGRVISYEPPRGWVLHGSSSQLILTLPETGLARATVDQVFLPAPQGFDAATIKNLRQIVLGSLPPDAEKVQLLSEEANPVRINGQDSYEIRASYSYFGQDQRISVIFANLGDLQLRFRFAANKKHFDALYRAFRGSLFSLHWS
jgi:hypothetical protein